LKEKVDAGADFVISQMFYDCELFLKFVKDARELGIQCPIIPGLMPIHTYTGFMRMTQFCKTKIPERMQKELSQLKTDDEEAVKQYGIQLGISMCRYLFDHGIKGVHFYTLNLEKTVLEILNGLDLAPTMSSVSRPLPWKVTANSNREKEDVRPIFWSNRPKSYLVRTSSWDEFPNGRWGDSRSPAFGEVGDYHLLGSSGKSQDMLREERLKNWGREHLDRESIFAVFVKYLRGETKNLPWYDKPISLETVEMLEQLCLLNGSGFLTINSQPRVNAAPSDDKAVGWGGPNGFVYQKAYIEFFCSPQLLDLLKKSFPSFPSLTYHAVNAKGDRLCSAQHRVNAVTWGVFPDSELKQPTVVDTESFLVWKAEAFSLWKTWASIYSSADDEDLGDNTKGGKQFISSKSRQLIQDIHDTYYLVNIVDNNFISGDIFAIFNKILQKI